MSVRIKLTVAYLGDDFSGWQRQPARPSVQGELEAALERMTGGVGSAVVGAGRTDAGVHAAGQVAHVDLPVDIPAAGLLKGLNGTLPRSIRVRSATRMPPTFHARKSALGKLYVYRAGWSQPGLPWLGLRTAVVAKISDEAAMRRAAALLVGLRDVASFTVPDAVTGSTERRLYRASIHRRRNGFEFSFVGDGFLRYQVRRMVGALLAVGRGRLDAGSFRRLLEQPSPGAPLDTAPARGLTLEKVYYRRLPDGADVEG
jgi:tRNA pseudouridine38-40 synthase